jgi:hypothetical protein
MARPWIKGPEIGNQDIEEGKDQGGCGPSDLVAKEVQVALFGLNEMPPCPRCKREITWLECWHVAYVVAYEKAFHCPICRASIFFDEVEASSTKA